jgi:hypothetical protein
LWLTFDKNLRVLGGPKPPQQIGGCPIDFFL